MRKGSMMPERWVLPLDILLGCGVREIVVEAGGNHWREVRIPRMRSCKVGKESDEGGVLAVEVNSISLSRSMILTVHKRARSVRIPSRGVVCISSQLQSTPRVSGVEEKAERMLQRRRREAVCDWIGMCGTERKWKIRGR